MTLNRINSVITEQIWLLSKFTNAKVDCCHNMYDNNNYLVMQISNNMKSSSCNDIPADHESGKEQN